MTDTAAAAKSVVEVFMVFFILGVVKESVAGAVARATATGAAITVAADQERGGCQEDQEYTKFAYGIFHYLTG